MRGVALFALVSMMNHSCEPNAVVEYPLGSFTAVVKAVKDIHRGDAVTISYDSAGDDVAARRRELSRYGFVC